MTLSPSLFRYLSQELSQADPWGLEGRPFEQRRHAIMRELIGTDLKYDSGLEVGCAAGAFTEFLATCCSHLRVIDVVPEAVRRCRVRLGDPPHVKFSVAQIGTTRGWRESYDLIVVAEVLYFLGTQARVAAAIAKIKKWLRPGGTVIFGAAHDEVSARWELPCGAETAMREWALDLEPVRSVECRGELPDEDCVIVQYRSPA